MTLGALGLYAALQILNPQPPAPPLAETIQPPMQTLSLTLPATPNEKPAPEPDRTRPQDTPAMAPGALRDEQIPQETAAITGASLESTPPLQAAQSVAAAEKESPAPEIYWKEHRIHPGESLALIFPKLELSAGLLQRIINSGKEAATLARIKPGETLRAGLDSDGNLRELVLEHNAINSLHIFPGESGFQTRSVERKLEPRITQATGTVENSLFVSAKRAGLPDRMIMELANIFGWDIDFALEIRAGDHFSVIYQEDYLDGRKFRDGPILAAEFVNRGHRFRALRYIDETGRADYFTPDGKSVRKAFLRSPVDFRRISSRFTRARWHPVLGKKRPHRGVDYAAATGTPIKASGDGRILFRGRKGGYGKAVIIEHGGGITTLYGHLSRYAGKQRRGMRVQQGQIIGYVGQTGLANGPHLHYEFRINGTHRNPLTVKLPAAAPIDKKYRADFTRQTAPLLTRLEALGNMMVAEATP